MAMGEHMAGERLDLRDRTCLPAKWRPGDGGCLDAAADAEVPERTHRMRLSVTAHSTSNGSINPANVTSGPCRPSTIASTISGASSVIRMIRVI